MPTRNDQRSSCPGLAAREELVTRPITEIEGLDQLFEDCLPAFGGSDLRRVWQLLDEAIGRGIPMTLSVAGPVTLSGQHTTWLNPLLDSGWFAMVSTTDAVCGALTVSVALIADSWASREMASSDIPLRCSI